MGKQTYLVTGGTSGLGFQCARFLCADRDNEVVITGRDQRAGELAARALRKGGGTVHLMPLELSTMASVRSFVDTFRRAGLPPLVGIVCNAGGQKIGTPVRTSDGFEATFAGNYLGHYLLTRLLLPELRPSGRIVFVSSGTHDPAQKTGMPAPRYVDARTTASDFEEGGEAGRRRYTTSKLCNVYGSYELARRLGRSADERLRSLRVNAVDPGLMPSTGLSRSYPYALRLLFTLLSPLLMLFMKNVHRPSVSGRRLAALVTDEQSTGKYFSDGRETRSSVASYDEKIAATLWDESAVMTGLPSAI